MSDSQHDADMKNIEAHAEQLGEHFDTVQIFCTRHEQGEHGGTLNFVYGLGHWHARYGHVRQWLVMTDEDARIHARKRLEDGK